MTHQISDKELADMKEQLDKQYADQDRLRLIRAAANSFRFSCSQLVELVRVQRYGNARNKTAILLYPNLVDPQNFESQVLPEYKRYREDREIQRTSLAFDIFIVVEF
jgi:hypothetical protein